MKRPFFSIMLPAKGRPHLVKDALASILQQDFGDFEILISNNGADPDVRTSLAGLLDDPRAHYAELPEVVNMPHHWELVSKRSQGHYLMVLPDRSVLKQGALAVIRDIHERHGKVADIVSWPWDLYYERAGLLSAYRFADCHEHVLSSEVVLRTSFSGNNKYPYALPRGLNSSVSTKLIEEIRKTTGVAFDRISPDFTLAYQSLMLRNNYIYLDKPLMLSQGLDISNGGGSFKGDVRPYLATLGADGTIVHAPVASALVETTIIEDLLRVCHAFGRADLIAQWDRISYYVRCFIEIDEKKSARLLDAAFVASLERDVQGALSEEPPHVRRGVADSLNRSRRRSGGLRALKNFVDPSFVTRLRPALLRMRGARRYRSALDAAGFERKP